MKKIISVTVELESKNIIVKSVDSDNGISDIQGFNPLIKDDWDLIDLEEGLSDYKSFFWDGIAEPKNSA